MLVKATLISPINVAFTMCKDVTITEYQSISLIIITNLLILG